MVIWAGKEELGSQLVVLTECRLLLLGSVPTCPINLQQNYVKNAALNFLPNAAV